ncbi:MAG TPA: hypothetical protein VF493_00930 [Terriglobales bacterium]
MGEPGVHRAQDEGQAPLPSNPTNSPARDEDSEEANPIDRLKDRVLQPVKHRIYRPINHIIARLGYTASVLLFLGLTSVTTMAVSAWRNPAEAKRVYVTARYYLEARRARPWADIETRAVMRDLINQLKDDISPSNRNRADGAFETWTEAQMVVSLQSQGIVDPAEMHGWFETQAAASHGWRQVWNAAQDPEQFGVTGWVLLAYAKMGVTPTREQIKFVLDHQHTPGWWSIFPATDDPRNACTYATALSVWSLQELMSRGLVSEPQRAKVADAIRKGRDWLWNNSVADEPGTWRDYPQAEYGQESTGVSGLVLHVLHRTEGPAPIEADKYWMAHLPDEMPEAKQQTSTSQFVVTLQKRPVADPTHNFSFPWLVIGTIDAYHEGTLSQRAQAARLLHQIGDKRRQIFIDAKAMPWLAAELLIGVRYLDGENLI